MWRLTCWPHFRSPGGGPEARYLLYLAKKMMKSQKIVIFNLMVQIDGFYWCGGSQADLIFDPQGEAKRQDTYCIWQKYENHKKNRQFLFDLFTKLILENCWRFQDFVNSQCAFVDFCGLLWAFVGLESTHWSA